MEDKQVYGSQAGIENLQMIYLCLAMVPVFTSLSAVSAIKNYEMQNYCNGEISMILQGIQQGQLTLNTPQSFNRHDTYPFHNRPSNVCEVTVETWITWNHLMFYFDGFDLPCSDGYLEFFDGDHKGQINGLQGQVCGSIPPGVFTIVNRKLKIKFTQSSRNYHYNAFSMIFTAYQEGSSCPNNNFECNNGRCIDDDIKCNGYNSCGDDSGCDLPANVVWIICVSLAGFIFIVTVFLIFKCCTRGHIKRNNIRSQPVVYNANTAGQQTHVVYGAQNQPSYVSGQPPVYSSNTSNPGYGNYPLSAQYPNQTTNMQSHGRQDQNQAPPTGQYSSPPPLYEDLYKDGNDHLVSGQTPLY